MQLETFKRDQMKQNKQRIGLSDISSTIDCHLINQYAVFLNLEVSQCENFD